MHKILVVDDNEAAAFALAKLLEFRGHETHVAYNGREAVRLVSELGPRVMFLDIGLPDIDGYEVARRLRANASDLKIIALSGYGQERDKAHARDAGCDAHLTKPAQLAQIEEAIRSVVS